MTGRIEKTVFISYRRTNFWTALAVFQNLNSNGYDAFFDYKSIPSGDFEQVITENVKSRAHFIVILSPSALERCHEPGDWLRSEIETAIDNKRNIIPLMMEGFDFGSTATVKALTGKLADLRKYNALGIPAEYFDEALAKLRGDRFLNRPLESVSHPVSEVTKQITEEQKSIAVDAAPVAKEQLTAQEWFERGYVFRDEGIFDEAIRCFTEGIKLDPKFPRAYTYRGLTREDRGEKELAFQDYTSAIRSGTTDHGAFVFRGFIREDNSDLDGAYQDYTEAIRAKPDEPTIYVFRGNISLKKGDFDDAIEDYTQALILDPNFANVYSYRGLAWEGKENFHAAIADFKKYLDLKTDLDADHREGIKSIIRDFEKKIE